MRTRSKLLLAGLTVALAFGAFVSASSANRLTVSGRQWRASWNKLEFLGIFATISCHVTIEGSFHSRTISKVLEALIGYVSRVTVDSTNCTGASARAQTETLPWHIRYNGFTGTLPSISEIHMRLVGVGLIVQTPTTRCLIKSTAASPLEGWIHLTTATPPVSETLKVNERAEIPVSSGEFFCGSTTRLEGTSTPLTEGPTTTKITVELVQ